MNIVTPQSGVDVSKDELVVSINRGKPFTKANTVEGCNEIRDLLPADGVVHIEASGGYERLLRRTLIEAGIKVVLHNPLKPRRMAQAQGTKAKTDAIDAKVLSEKGALLPETSVKSLDRQSLTDHSRAIDVLRDCVADLKKRMKMPELGSEAHEIYKESIADLQERIAQAEKSFEERIQVSAYADQYAHVKSVPALGKMTARICVCEFPEDVKERTPAQIASYAGLAPIDDTSGKKKKPAHIGHGNPRLKRSFYMPAICAIRTQAWARSLYARLTAKGKSHQVAIVAVMRRLLIRAAAVVQRGSAWEAEPQKT
jgi:transposase